MPRRDGLLRRRRRDRFAVEPNLAPGRRLETEDDARQLRAACADEPRQADDLAAPHRQRDVLNPRGLGREAGQFEHGRADDHLALGEDCVHFAADHQPNQVRLRDIGHLVACRRCGRRGAPSPDRPAAAVRRAGVRCRSAPSPCVAGRRAGRTGDRLPAASATRWARRGSAGARCAPSARAISTSCCSGRLSDAASRSTSIRAPTRSSSACARRRRAGQSTRDHGRSVSTPIARFSATLRSGKSAGCW